MNTQSSSVEEHLSARMETTGRVIANFALQHFRAAVTFRDQVATLEAQYARQPFGPFFDDVRSYGSACIMSAAAALEALINEFFITPEGPLRAQFGNFETEFWGDRGIERKAPLRKYQNALEMLGIPKFNEHIGPYRDAWALFELRNALVHFKPTWDPDRRRRVELVDILRNQYELSPFPDSGADFVTMRSMSSSCMHWVVTTAITFMREFHARAQLDELKMSAFWRLAA